MLRITRVGAENAPGIIKIEGQIAGDHVGELSRFAATALEEEPRLGLDLSDVTFVDQAGAVVLRALRDRGVEFVRTSPFISSLVNGLPTEIAGPMMPHRRTGGAE